MKNQCAKKKRYMKRRRYGQFLHVILLVSVIMVTSVIYNTRYVYAQEKITDSENASMLQYKSIVVQDGDSLWNIASEYITDDFDSVKDYIRFLKNVNNLSSDTICVNQALIVAYEPE